MFVFEIEYWNKAMTNLSTLRKMILEEQKTENQSTVF